MRGNWIREYLGNSAPVPSSQFFCKSKTFQKIKPTKEKKSQSRETITVVRVKDVKDDGDAIHIVRSQIQRTF